ncbi:hypothetical protein EON63_00785 [archaeon]|nr:MAG: hypothetical protein EON63_00785 [archaeon]
MHTSAMRLGWPPAIYMCVCNKMCMYICMCCCMWMCICSVCLFTFTLSSLYKPECHMNLPPHVSVAKPTQIPGLASGCLPSPSSTQGLV